MKYKVFSIIFSILLVITLPLALCSCSTQKSSKNDEIILRIANWEEYLDEGDWDDDEEIREWEKDHREKFDDQRF